ncbi:MAG: thioredoxin family protein [Thermodesulfobacteriota bacterium]
MRLFKNASPMPALTRLMIVLPLLLVLIACGQETAESNQELPVKGMVNLVDVGAGSCIPCKMMAPILEELKKEFEGKAIIAYIDVRYDRAAVEKYRIRGIPTQIFYDAQGKEVSRHLGFMDKESIKAALAKLGVK